MPKLMCGRTEENKLFDQSTIGLLQKIEAQRESLSMANQRIATHILNSPKDFMHQPLQKLAVHISVSQPTLIRFCRALGYKGVPDFRIALAVSLAGQGASAPGTNGYFEPTLLDKMVVNFDTKMEIAKAAVHLTEADRSLILDSGSTLLAFASLLKNVARKTIFTTSLGAVDLLSAHPVHSVMLPAGTLRFESRSIGGRMVEKTLANMRFDTGYFGADSIDISTGISTYNEEEAHQCAAMLAACARVVVLADSSKFGNTSLHRIGPMSQIHTIVTDEGLPEAVREKITGMDIQLIIASRPTPRA